MRVALGSAIIVLLCAHAPVAAQTGLQDCRKLKSDAERLACYDKLPSKPRKADAPIGAPVKPTEEPVIAAAKAATLKLLREPESAKFSNLTMRTAADGAKGVCGEVNARNAMGGMSGPKLMVYDGKMARIMISSDGAENPTSFDRLLIGVMLRETLNAYDRFCK